MTGVQTCALPISRFGPFAKALRAALQALEKTPLRFFGLSHFWVVEKIQD